MKVGIESAVKQSTDWLSESLEAVMPRSEKWGAVRHYVRPSGVYSPCTRAAAFSLLGHSGSVNAQGVRRMDNGTSMHARWGEYFSHLPEFVCVEAPLAFERLHGSIDVVLKKSERFIVGELKSINSRGWGYLPNVSTPSRNLAALTERHPAYVAQTLTYAKFYPAEEGFLLFENKDTQEFKIYMLPYDETVLRKLTLGTDEALIMIEAGILPDRDYEKASLTCRRCDHREQCWNGKEAELIAEKLLEAKL